MASLFRLSNSIRYDTRRRLITKGAALSIRQASLPAFAASQVVTERKAEQPVDFVLETREF